MLAKRKYRNEPIMSDGILFSSKAEMRRYEELKILKRGGHISFFLLQVPFKLPGNVKYLCDFMIIWEDGRLTFEDVKGYDTMISKLKRKQVEALYPVKIEIVSYKK